MLTINERMRQAGVSPDDGYGYTIAHMLSWAEQELNKLEDKAGWCAKNYVLPLAENMEKGETE